MAGDWIKMRGNLTSHPKVLRIAAILEESPEVGAELSTGFGGPLSEIVTRNVTRDVTLASLLRVWCATNDHTTDGTWQRFRPEDFDQIAGVPGFGAAMEAVGWAIYDKEKDATTLPGFLLHNAPAKGGRASNAERQKRYRERHKSNAESNAESNVTSNVTSRVTSNVEKRREDIPPKAPPPGFAAFWQSYPNRRRIAKAKCLEIWVSKHLEAAAAQIALHVEAMKLTPDWLRDDGKYIPASSTYLGQRRFEDGTPETPKPRLVI